MKITKLIVTSTLFSTFFAIAVTSMNAYGQEKQEDVTTATNVNFIINIREISSITEKNLIVLLSSENGVQVKKVNISEAVIQPGQEDSFSPNKMMDVAITMNEPVETGSEIYACVIQLGSSSSIECNIAYASPTASGEPQRIIVPL